VVGRKKDKGHPHRTPEVILAELAQVMSGSDDPIVVTDFVAILEIRHTQGANLLRLRSDKSSIWRTKGLLHYALYDIGTD
jgi:hypothetical protein